MTNPYWLLKRKLFGLLTVFYVSIASLTGADVLTLINAAQFEGEVLKIKKSTVLFSVGEDVYIIPVSDIYALEFEDTDNKVYKKYLKLLESNPSKCHLAKFDAENLHGKKGGHFILGALFGPFALIGTALADPTPYKGKNTLAMSKNKEIFNDPEYLSCYRKKARSQLLGAEALGWATWILIVITV